ncbi:MAG: hypothetical protein K2N78_06975 [Oscillospiraceae bacterium]|nr:hypothetical protein [Oscillospiraceae bacterium]
MMVKEQLEAAILQILDKLSGYQRQPDRTFLYEIFADYRDVMAAREAIEILQSDDPLCTLYDRLNEWYLDCQLCLSDELEGDVQEKLAALYPDGFTDEDEDEIHEILTEKVCFELPVKHFMSQSFRANIMVDTGDGNYDYTLNSVYPCWYGDYKSRIDSKAGIVWLAKSQGYTKTQLWKALREGDMANPKGFLESMRVEVANIASSMCTVTFLVEMTLEALLELNRLIRLQDRNGHFYDATRNPYCGYIILDKSTETGLYDPWSGGGSCFEIELERDVRLPVKYIRSALPDGGDGHSVERVYGMCGSAWRDSVKLIHAPARSLSA